MYHDTVVLDGAEPVTIYHMGSGEVVLSQFTEAAGACENITGDSFKLVCGLMSYHSLDQLTALSARAVELAATYRDRWEPKNTDRREPANA